MTDASDREIILKRAKKQLSAINNYFNDIAHWNDTRTIFEQIEPDPDGAMRRMKTHISVFIAENES